MLTISLRLRHTPSTLKFCFRTLCFRARNALQNASQLENLKSKQNAYKNNSPAVESENLFPRGRYNFQECI